MRWLLFELLGLVKSRGLLPDLLVMREVIFSSSPDNYEIIFNNNKLKPVNWSMNSYDYLQ